MSAFREYHVAFYNVENLFDTKDNPLRNDEEFLPGSARRWSESRYQKKLNSIARSLASIHRTQLPVVIGLAEIENRKVLEDLVDQPVFGGRYAVAQFESPDRRGIDVALLYDREILKFHSSERLKVTLPEEPNFRTRDILHVSGTIGQDKVHFFVNHWSSRREGTRVTMPRRIAAAEILYERTKELLRADPNAKLLLMGDFNDHPLSPSMVQFLHSKGHKPIKTGEFYNLAYLPHRKNHGSVYAKGKWLMFDQILISKGLLSGPGIHVRTNRLTVHYKKHLLFYDRKTQIYRPNRTYSGKKYHGGYSDHLPVYIKLIKDD